MIVIGSDAHKASYTCASVSDRTGEQLGVQTVRTTRAGHEQLLAWARALAPERVWAVEDCRGVSGKLERFLLARGERVLRVPPKLMAGRRRGSRQAGKSDPIDALAVARAALEEGLESLPVAALAGPEREIKLLLDHRDDLIAEGTRIQNRLRWLLHDRWPELELPRGCLTRIIWLERLKRRLAREQQSAEVRVMRAQIARLRQLVQETNALQRELAALVAAQQPALLDLPGIGTLNAARLVCEIAGIQRFHSPAKLARMAGVAPIPASSGARHRFRLDRGGNRQINAAVHRMAITQLRCHPPAKTYIERKTAEGKSKKEAIRALKRQLINIIYKTLTPAPDLT
jgi:transposase